MNYEPKNQHPGARTPLNALFSCLCSILYFNTTLRIRWGQPSYHSSKKMLLSCICRHACNYSAPADMLRINQHLQTCLELFNTRRHAQSSTRRHAWNYPAPADMPSWAPADMLIKIIIQTGSHYFHISFHNSPPWILYRLWNRTKIDDF